MFVNKKDRKNIIGEVTINFGKSLGFNTDEEVFITCRDMTVEEALRFKLVKDDEVSQYEEFKKVLPSLIKDHNFYEDEDCKDKMSNEEVVDIIFETWASAQIVYNTFLVFMFRRLK